MLFLFFLSWVNFQVLFVLVRPVLLPPRVLQLSIGIVGRFIFSDFRLDQDELRLVARIGHTLSIISCHVLGQIIPSLVHVVLYFLQVLTEFG